VIAEIDRINKRLSSKYPHSIEATRGKQVASSKTNNLATRSSLLVPIVTTGFIQEDELPTAYAGALAYVIPSLSEGFGLPPLEAMACGTPVISSNVSCMPEILGQAPLYFDPYNIEDIEKAIEKVTGDDKLRAELSKKGLEQAKKYDWKRTAEQTLEVYKEVLGTNIIKR